MLSHVRRWHRSKQLKVRVRMLNDSTGLLYYQTKNFPIIISDLDKYNIISADFQDGKITKRKKQSNSGTKIKPQKDAGDLLGEATALIPDVLAALGEGQDGRQEDFVQVLRSIHDGKMSNNLSLMLLLDVGNKFKQKHPKCMRYKTWTIDLYKPSCSTMDS